MLAYVTIQSDKNTGALRLITANREDGANLYSVIGFEKCPIKILDYRVAPKLALPDAMINSKYDEFISAFNTSADIFYEMKGSHVDTIILRDATGSVVENRLWIAVGAEDHLPVYEYYFHEISWLTTGKISLVALYTCQALKDSAMASGRKVFSDWIEFENNHESLCR